MISNKSLFALFEEMGNEGFISKMQKNTDECKACRLFYHQLGQRVLSLDCPPSSEDGNEALLREHDKSVKLYHYNFNTDQSLGRYASNKYNGKPTGVISKSKQQILTNYEVPVIFGIVTNRESKQLCEFADISEVKEFIMSQSEFIAKTIATITEAKLEAQISAL